MRSMELLELKRAILTWDAGIPSDSLTCCTTVPALLLDFFVIRNSACLFHPSVILSKCHFTTDLKKTRKERNDALTDEQVVIS